jgi:mannose-6-phosphate isomerase-like protein (cupin superfamily)
LRDETDRGAVEDPLDRLRSFCTMLPEVAEIDGLGRPTFRVATRGFAVYEEIGGRPSVTVKLPVEHQAAVLAEHAGASPEEETGHHGWTVLDIGALGWPAVDQLVVAGYRRVAPPELAAQLDALLGGGTAPAPVPADAPATGPDGPIPADAQPTGSDGQPIGCAEPRPTAPAAPTRFPTVQVADQPAERAPDGAEVRPMLAGPGASVARFRLPAGTTSRPCRHRTINEIWFVIAGSGEFWRRSPDGVEEVVPVGVGTGVLVAAGVAFQVRAHASGPLDAVGTTMPPWPASGAGEVEVLDEGRWPATVPPD